MTLGRVWRRHLWAASGAALTVPAAILAALAVLALGGGFSQLGVLGQIVAGPPAPTAGPLPLTGTATRGGGAAIPVTPVGDVVASRPARHRARGGAVVVSHVPTSPTVTRTSAPPAGTPLPVAASPRPVSPSPAPSQAPPLTPPPARSPSPQPTLADRAVQVVTSVTSQVPPPVGSTATKVVQSASSAIDQVLP